MNLTRKQAIDLHRELWGWLAESGKEFKSDWPGWNKQNVGTFSLCFLCEYVKGRAQRNMCVTFCPLVWPGNYNGEPVCHWDGLFNRWLNSPDTTTRKTLAAQIRDLPVKEDIIFRKF